MTPCSAVDPPRKVLIYHIGSLGDTLMALPAMWALRDLWPCSSFSLLTKRTPLKHVVVADSILEGTGLFQEIIDYPGTRYGGGNARQRFGQALVFGRIAARRFDTAVYLAPSERARDSVCRDMHFFRLAGVKRLIGFRHLPLPPSRDQRPLPQLPIEADALLSRMQSEGLRMPALKSARRDCGVTAEEVAALDVWVRSQQTHDRGRPWLALAPGSNMAAKIWPLERYAAVASTLVREFDLWPVIFGGPEDRAAGSRLQTLLGTGHMAAGALPLRVAAAGMRRSSLYVGNDTGTMHLAASEGVPCVVPFSARDFPGKWHPIGPEHAIIRRRPSCEGCMLEHCEKESMQCLIDISTDEVTSHARRLLQAALANQPQPRYSNGAAAVAT
jgi:hypothetical protein